MIFDSNQISLKKLGHSIDYLKQCIVVENDLHDDFFRVHFDVEGDVFTVYDKLNSQMLTSHFAYDVVKFISFEKTILLH